MLLLADAHYRCTSCGDCCRGWAVPLEDGEADRFRQQAATLVPADRLRGAVGRDKQAGRMIDTLVGGGRQCVALAEDQLCRVHATFGAEAKPRACRIFPFTFVATPSAVRVGLSFACPAVIDAEGPRLEEQRGEIEALFASAVDDSRYLLHVGAEVTLAPGRAVAWADAERLLGEMLAALGDTTRPLVERVCHAGADAALVQAGLEEGRDFAAALAHAQAERERLIAEVLAEEPSIDRLSRALFRTLLKSTEPGRHTAGGRVGGALAALLGTRVVKLQVPASVSPTHSTDEIEVAWKDVEAVRPGLGPDGEALLTRWLSNAIASCTFFGDAAFGLGLAAGLDLLVMSAAVAAFLARAHAAANRRTAVTLDDAKRGLRQLDSGLTHRSSMPRSFGRALEATASLDLLREQLG
jgi:lysine-N-methylase